MKRIAIIGTGNISGAHIEGYLRLKERCKIVALVDIYPEKAQGRKDEFSLDCEVYDSHKALLGRQDIDLIDICTPPYTHCEIALDFLNDKKNVMIEKPMAASVQECERIIAAAEKSGTLLSVVSQNRFNNAIWKLKAVLDSGLIGRINHVNVQSQWWRGHCYYDLWWRGSWEKENGGCTLNHAVHHIDMLCWMMGRPSDVSSMIANVAHDNAEVEDLSVTSLRYPNGALGQLTASVVHHGEEQGLVFQGEFAKISAPWSVYASLAKPNGFPVENVELRDSIQKLFDSIPDNAYQGHTAQLDNVLTALETGGQPLMRGEDGKASVELITAIYKSGSSGTITHLPLDPNDDFYSLEGILKNVPYFYEKSKSEVSLGDSNISLGSTYK